MASRHRGVDGEHRSAAARSVVADLDVGEVGGSTLLSEACELGPRSSRGWRGRTAPGSTRRSIARRRPDGRSTRRASSRPASRSRQWCTVATTTRRTPSRQGAGVPRPRPAGSAPRRRRRRGRVNAGRRGASLARDRRRRPRRPRAGGTSHGHTRSAADVETSSSGPTSASRMARSASAPRPTAKLSAARRPPTPAKAGKAA